MKKLLFTFLFLFLIATQGWTVQVVTWQGDGGTDTNWSTANNWHGSVTDHVKPAAGDSVVFNNAVNCTLNENTASIASLNCTGYTGILSHSSGITLTVAGNVTLVSGMGYTAASRTSAITITGTGNFYSGGKSIGDFTVNGSGITVTLQDNFDGNDKTGDPGSSLNVTAGTLDTNNKTISTGRTTVSSGANLILSSNTLTFAGGVGGGCVLDLRLGSVTIGTATVNVNSNGSTGIKSGGNIYNLVINLGTSSYIYFPNGTTITSLTINGAASKTSGFRFSSGETHTITNLTIAGNSSINRLLIRGETLGTSSTITVRTGGSVTLSNVDFRDIHLHNTDADPYNASAITGGSGDCGGNTGITFTTADDWYWNGSGTRNFSDYTYWYTATNGGGSQMASTRCPLPQDTCYINGDSIDGATTIDQDLPRVCKTLDCTSASAFNLHLNNVAQTFYGGLTLVANVTITAGDVYFESGDRSGSNTFTTAGKTLSNIYFQNLGATLVISGNMDATYDIFHLAGTLDCATNDPNVTARLFYGYYTWTRTLNMGDGTWTADATIASIPWQFSTTTNLTLNANGSTIVMGYNGTNAQTFKGGNLTYNNLSIVGGSTQVTTIEGSNNFNTFTINAPKTVKLTAGTTTTVNSLVATGDADNLIHIDSTTSSSASIVDTSGTNTVHYCHIGETGAVNASGGATWDATDNCQVNSSTGWTVATANTTNFFQFFN